MTVLCDLKPTDVVCIDNSVQFTQLMTARLELWTDGRSSALFCGCVFSGVCFSVTVNKDAELVIQLFLLCFALCVSCDRHRRPRSIKVVHMLPVIRQIVVGNYKY